MYELLDPMAIGQVQAIYVVVDKPRKIPSSAAIVSRAMQSV
jgi:hypothetical protein